MRIDQNEIHHIECIGSGAFGRVYEARWKQDRVVACKVMKYPVHYTLFWREIDILKKFNHPNIVRYVGYVHHETCMMIVMERAPGVPLTSCINHYDMSSNVRFKISFDVLRVLVHLHTHLVLYRDLKPDNIIVDLNTHNIKIVDFGNAVVMKTPEKMVRGIVGTLGYMAPEVVMDKYYTFPVDVFSYGATLYGIWTESEPTKISRMRTKTSSSSHIPEYIKRTILMCLEHKPTDRPSATEILDDLERYSLMDHDEHHPPSRECCAFPCIIL